jgi:hypothetical protein
MAATIEVMMETIHGPTTSARPPRLAAVGLRSVTTLIAADMANVRESLMRTTYEMDSLSPAS